MEGKCPNCQARLELPHSGAYRCERCGARFEVTLGADRPPQVAAPRYPYGAAPAGHWPTELGPEMGAFILPTAPGNSAPADWSLAEAVEFSGAPCAVHPGNPAERVCERCGDFMCHLCTTLSEGRAYCPKCYELLHQRGGLIVSRQRAAPAGLILFLGLSGLFAVGLTGGLRPGAWVILVVVILLGLPLSTVGLLLGIRALRLQREKSDLPRGMLVAGSIASGAALLASLGMLAWALGNLVS
jgi:hypothetical protein